ncbi:MAG: class I SAM-dependent methyltransferase [Actinomycetota bacterium]|nr:class I SAM-dependent methyltransferase [Actinomycetota bacterium]
MTDDIRTVTMRALWDDAASIYQDVMEPALRGPHLAVRPLVGDVRGLGTLDLGCGTGAVSELLGPAGARVTAVDLAPHMVAVARERLAGVRGVVGIDVMNAQKPDLPDASFDLVVAALSLMFCPDHPAKFAGVHRVLCPADGW